MRVALNLDQLWVFASVAEEGSFSAAARRLGRAQSAITYAIQELEADLGTALFDRTGYRPTLSEAGRALLPRARRMLSEALVLQAQAAGIARGLESSLSLVVDAMFPMPVLTGALAAFFEAFPTVVTRVRTEALGATADVVVEGEVELGLVIAAATPPDGLERRPAGTIELVPVCAPGHFLAIRQATDPRPIPADDLRDQLQLILSDRSPRTRDQEHGIASPITWRLADLGAKHAMLRAGLGWGSLPRHLAAEDIAAGRLVELKLDQWSPSGRLPQLEVIVIHRLDRVLGPAGRWLADRLALDGSGPE